MKLDHILRNLPVHVLGAGKTGVAACRLLAKLGARITLSDISSSEAIREQIKDGWESCDIRVQGNGHRLETLLESPLNVISPGVPRNQPVIESAAQCGATLISELELACHCSRGPIVGITGTNGKTTTSYLIGEMLRAGGVETTVGGNNEIPFSQLVLEIPAPDSSPVLVLEVSSFQLENIFDFRPHVGIFLNLTPDHLDRYSDLDHYCRTKFRLFENQNEEDWQILNADDPEITQRVADNPRKLLWFSLERPVRPGAYLEDGNIMLGIGSSPIELMSANAVRLRGRHNLYNTLAACLAASKFDIAPESIAETLRTFQGVEHRLEEVADIEGVLFVNDSKATNVDSMKVALESFEAPLILIAGGRGKGSDYSILNTLIQERVKALVLIGEEADSMAAVWGGLAEPHRAEDMKEAVRKAHSLAQKGDCVLLSPACASFDMYRDFEERGQNFKEAVRKLAGSFYPAPS